MKGTSTRILFLVICTRLLMTSCQTEQADDDRICIEANEVNHLQTYIQTLSNNADSMKAALEEHVLNLANSSDPVVMATWLNLIKLHLTVNEMYENFTQWVEENSEELEQDTVEADMVTNESLGFIVFNLWGELQKLKLNVSHLQLNRDYYNIKLQNLDRQQENIVELSQMMDKIQRGMAMYGHKLTDLNMQMKAVQRDSALNMSQIMHELTAMEYHAGGTSNDSKEDGPVVIDDDQDRMLSELQGQVRALQAAVERLQNQSGPGTPASHQDSESSITAAAPTGITFANCNAERRHQVGNSCYYIPRLEASDKLYTWWDARYFCKRMMGDTADLVAIETEPEMVDLVNLLTNHFGGIQEIWLGASDLQSEETWTWAATREALNEDSYANWAHPPPYNTASNCMSMLRGYEWVDEPCFYERYPLCEVNLGL